MVNPENLIASNPPNTITDRRYEEQPLLYNQKKRSIGFKYTVLGVSYITFVSSLEVTGIATIGPTISLDYKDISLVQHIVTTTLLFSTASTPICAKLSDAIGRKPVLLLSSVVYTLGSLLCATSTSVLVLLLGRSISGLGLGGISVIVSIILSETVELKERALWHSVGKMIACTATSIGGPLGGWITDHYNWRMVFYSQAFLGFTSSILVILLLLMEQDALTSLPIVFSPGISLPSGGKPRYPYRCNIFGCIFLLVTLVTGNLTFSRISDDIPIPFSLTRHDIKVLLGISCLFCLTSFIISEKRAKDPILSMSHFRLKSATSIFIIIFSSSTIYQAILCNAPLYAVIVSHVSAEVAGTYILPISFAAVFATLLAGLRVTRTQRCKGILLLGVIFVTLGPFIFLITSLLSTEARGYIPLQISGTFPSAFGFHIVNSISILALLAYCAQEDIASLTSHASLFKSLGGVFGTSFSAYLLGGLQAALDAKNMTDDIYMPSSESPMTKARQSFAIMFGTLVIISLPSILVVAYGVSEITPLS